MAVTETEIDITFQYPHELIQLLIKTIPSITTSKKDVLLFFRGAGIKDALMSDLINKVRCTPNEIYKYDIVREVLNRINAKGDAGLRERREVLRRVTEFENFSSCYPDQQAEARGYVSEVRALVNVKDSFTRMKQERDTERQERMLAKDAEAAKVNEKRAAIESVHKDLCALFGESDPWKRGKKLEAVLNRMFEVYGILVRDAFTVRGDQGQGIVEQIDGVIKLDGIVYLVEMKWLSESLGPEKVSTHMCRVIARGCSRGLFISASEYTAATIEMVIASKQDKLFLLTKLQEFVLLLERQDDLATYLKNRCDAAISQNHPMPEPRY